jgi:hypothetical protein
MTGRDAAAREAMDGAGPLKTKELAILVRQTLSNRRTKENACHAL